HHRSAPRPSLQAHRQAGAASAESGWLCDPVPGSAQDRPRRQPFGPIPPARGGLLTAGGQADGQNGPAPSAALSYPNPPPCGERVFVGRSTSLADPPHCSMSDMSTLLLLDRARPLGSAAPSSSSPAPTSPTSGGPLRPC